MDIKPKRIGRIATIAVLLTGAGLFLTACQFQPLYTSNQSTTGSQNLSLANLSVSPVDSREGQQVRNHLIFLLSGGAEPVSPSHEVRLRVTSSSTTLASRISDADSSQLGNTAGQVRISASYEIYDIASKEVIARGNRSAAASFDKTNQNFASSRAERDAQNRAAREAAEQVRLAVSADLNRV